MRPVEFRRHLNRERTTPQRLGSVFRVRRRGQEIAAHGKEYLRLPLVHRKNAVHHIVAVFARHVEVVMPFQGLQQSHRWLLENAHRPVALNVRVAAHRAGSSAGFADAAFRQKQIDHLLDRGHRFPMLRDAHRPAGNDPPLVTQQAGEGLNLRAGEAAFCHQHLKVLGQNMRPPPLKPVRGRPDERFIPNRLRIPQQQLRHGLEEREVATHPDLQVEVGQRGFAAEHPAHLLRVLERHEARLDERVDGDNLRPAAMRLLQGGEHAGVVRAGVLAGDEDDLGLFEVLEFHTAFADAEGFAERHATRLVAHVAAVGQVVRAEAADEELVQKSGFIARPAGGVENGFMGMGQTPEPPRHLLQRLVPGNRDIMIGPGRQPHGLGDSAFFAHREVVPGRHFRNAVRRKKVGGQALFGGLFGDGFRAVFAVLPEAGAFVIGIGPRAAGAVHAALLVEGEQSARCSAGPHFPKDVLDGDGHAREARCGAGGRADPKAVREFRRGLGSGRFAGR